MPCVSDSKELLREVDEQLSFRAEIVAGLTQTPKRIESKFFYDATGAELFERICELEEYYPTRTEVGIFREHLKEMAELLGLQLMIIEFGSGAGTKTKMLLDALENPAVYVPIDISKEQLADASAALERAYPRLEVLPIAQDYTHHVEIPKSNHFVGRRLVFFPGSTLGNFEPDQAESFLAMCRGLIGETGAILLGVDLRKDRDTLERAYNDHAGVTARFNLHLIERIRDELHVAIDPNDFEHFAFFNDEASRIEMHLVVRRTHCVDIGQSTICFESGERILTEYSYKYSIASLGALAAEADLRIEKSWEDPRGWFGEFYLVPQRSTYFHSET